MHLFADGTPLFTCVNGITETHDKLVKDLETIDVGLSMEMVFNPDI